MKLYYVKNNGVNVLVNEYKYKSLRNITLIEEFDINLDDIVINEDSVSKNGQYKRIEYSVLSQRELKEFDFDCMRELMLFSWGQRFAEVVESKFENGSYKYKLVTELDTSG